MVRKLRDNRDQTLLDAETRRMLLDMKGPDAWVRIARVLHEKVEVDLENDANANLDISIDNINFGFLRPDPEQNVFTTISFLADLHGMSDRDIAEKECNEVLRRYHCLQEAIDHLLVSMSDRAIWERQMKSERPD